jgi:hypothetical protein
LRKNALGVVVQMSRERRFPVGFLDAGDDPSLDAVKARGEA